MTHAAESLHWYTRDGRPAYEVEAVKGGMRPTTLRDARKLGLVPSVTNIIRCAAAPGLERWKQQQVLMAALTLPKIAGETEEGYLERIMRDSQEQARKAADRGSAIHAAIQGSFEDETPTEEMWPYVKGAVEVLAANCGDYAWRPETPFAHVLGFGGKVDLSCRDWVVDFKTKEFGPKEVATLKTWEEQEMQLAAYRRGLRLETARCAIVYVSATHPGLARFIEIDEADLVKGWKCFYSLLHYWQAKTGYTSAFQREPVAA